MVNVSEGRTERVGVRLSVEEADVVAQLVIETGLSASDVVRQALRKAHADRFQAPKRKKARRA